MQHHIETIVKHLFQKASLSDVALHELEQFTSAHPYSAIGQLLLTEKKRRHSHESFNTQAVKTSLYFNNPVWFNWLISDHPQTDLSATSTSSVNHKGEYDQVPETTAVAAAASDPHTEVLAETPAPYDPPNDTPSPIEEAKEHTQPDGPEFKDPDIPEAAIKPDNNVSPSSETTEAAYTDPENGYTEKVTPNIPKTVADPDANPSAVQFNAADVNTFETAEEKQHSVSVTAAALELSDEADLRTENPSAASAENDQPTDTGSTTYNTIESSFAAEIAREEVAELPSSQPTEAPQAENKQVENNTTPAVNDTSSKDTDVFEPYHTIDYFASQGIKLRFEEQGQPDDKLGRQLKSFTEWLRSMKRIKAGATQETIDDTTQQSIQISAEHSVEGRDIVTEAMAEVWIKQGNYRKAIAIYEKLSLQNPIKTPYFADRIQQLNALI